MGNIEENVKKAENLISQARQREKCVNEAKATQEAIDNLKEEAKFTLGEKLAIAAVGLGAIVGAILTGGVGAIILIGIGGLSELGILANHTARVKKANEKLEKAIKELEDCLNR